jgi:predicted O-methyltransferase YrrM
LIMSRGLLAPHGLLLIDNVLWKGQVLERLDPDAIVTSSDAARSLKAPERRSLALRDALHDFSVALAMDARVHQLMLPVRDGLTWAQMPAPAMAAAAHLSASRGGAGDERLAAYLQCVGGAEPRVVSALRNGAFDADVATGCGPQQGRLLSMLVRLSRASRVLEVGCFSGYAALWMALALEPTGGKLLSLERDEVAAAVARRHLDAAGVGDRVEVRLGDAFDSLKALPDDAPPFEVICWREPSNAKLPTGNIAPGLVAHLAPHGLLVVVHSMHSDVARTIAAVSSELDVSVVTIPSPDADGSLISLFSLGPDAL